MSLGQFSFRESLTLFPSVANQSAIILGKRLALLRQPAIVITLANTTVWAMGGYIVYTYLSSLLEHLIHLQGASISIMFLLFGLTGMIGTMIGGYGADHWGAVRTIVFGLLGLIAAFFALSLVSGSLWGMACVIGLWGIAGWLLIPPPPHRLITLAPKSVNVILSLDGSARYMGIGTGAALGGLVVQYLSLSALGWVAGVFELLALIVLYPQRLADSQCPPFF